MSERVRGTRLIVPVLFLSLLIAASLAGCSPAGEGDGGRTYTVRGQVRQLPDPNSPGSGISINHEAIDEYVNRQGEKVGMDPMTMSFPVAEDVALEEIAAGDIIEFDLHVDWEAEREVEITRIRELPAGTQLDFRAAQPTNDEP